MNCKDCNYKKLEVYSGGMSRYYCTNPDASYARSECEPTPLISKNKRHSTEITIKTAPKWCPINNKEG